MTSPGTAKATCVCHFSQKIQPGVVQKALVSSFFTRKKKEESVAVEDRSCFSPCVSDWN